MLKEFRDFILRGNVIDLAVGIVIGAAFGALVTSFVGDVLTPLLGLLQIPDFTELSFAAGTGTVNYGLFLNSLVDFVIVSFCIFLITKIAMKPAPAPAGPAMKECPQCGEQILSVAKRCRHCTSTV